jgi:hypothetical protein
MNVIDEVRRERKDLARVLNKRVRHISREGCGGLAQLKLSEIYRATTQGDWQCPWSAMISPHLYLTVPLRPFWHATIFGRRTPHRLQTGRPNFQTAGTCSSERPSQPSAECARNRRLDISSPQTLSAQHFAQKIAVERAQIVGPQNFLSAIRS